MQIELLRMAGKDCSNVGKYLFTVSKTPYHPYPYIYITDLHDVSMKRFLTST